MVSIWTPLLNDTIAAALVLLAEHPLPVAGPDRDRVWRCALAGDRRRREVLPFLLTMSLFLLSFLGLAVSLWPNVIPPEITIWDAASPPETRNSCWSACRS